MSFMVRDALRQITSLGVPVDELSDDDNLFAAGMTSFDLVNLIVCLEDMFAIEFPGDIMSPDHFLSVARIDQTISSLNEKESTS